MRFLFRLDLSLHARAGKKIWNLEVCNQTRYRIKDLQDTLSSCCSIGEVSKHGQNTDAILVMN